jgi:hypothetical protein
MDYTFTGTAANNAMTCLTKAIYSVCFESIAFLVKLNSANLDDHTWTFKVLTGVAVDGNGNIDITKSYHLHSLDTALIATKECFTTEGKTNDDTLDTTNPKNIKINSGSLFKSGSHPYTQLVAYPNNDVVNNFILDIRVRAKYAPY